MKGARLLVAAALIVGLCGLGQSSLAVEAIGNDDATSRVQALLDVRVRAVASGDKDAFMATLDPQADPQFRETQSLAFEGIRTVPLVDYALRVRLDDAGDLGAGSGLADRHGAARAFLPETRQTYRLAGYDDRAAIGSLWLTYVERDGRWYVAAEDDLADLGVTSTRDLWDFGPVAVATTPHFMVLTKPEKAERGRALAAIGEEAMASFRSRWKLPWSEKVPMIVPGTPQEEARLLGQARDVANFAAFVTYTPIRDNGWSTTAPRVYAQEANSLTLSRAQQVSNMIHELTHAATSHLSGPFTPTWVHEGLAEYVRLGATVTTPPRGHPDRLPLNSEFTAGDADSLRLIYAGATSVMSYVARLRGPAGPTELFTAIGSRRVVAGSPAYNVDAAVRDSTGQSIADLEAGWLRR